MGADGKRRPENEHGEVTLPSRVTEADLLGSWLLDGWEAQEDGKFKNHPFGPQAQGFLHYGADGWMSAVLTFPPLDRPHFARANLRLGTAEERAAAAATYVSYAGTWELIAGDSGVQVRHNVAFALLPNWVGTALKRDAEWVEHAGTRMLLLSTEPERTSKGTVIVNRLRWRRP